MDTSGNAIRFAFQPMYSLHTGGAIALEALAYAAPSSDGSVARMLAEAHRDGRLAEADVALAAHAVAQEAERETLLPLHLNITAYSAATGAAGFGPLLDALDRAGRPVREVVLEVGPPFSRIAPPKLIDGLHELAELGFRVALDGVGRADLPLTLLAAAPLSMVKADAALTQRLGAEPSSNAIFEALVHFATRTSTRLVATGIDTEIQLNIARELGARIAQGALFSDSANGNWRDGVTAPIPVTTGDELSAAAVTAGPPVVRDFLRPATTLPADATCEDVRAILAGTEHTTGIVGVDPRDRPQWSIDRSRFLLAFTGPYGHALHAKRPAARLADAPHAIGVDASALEFLDLVADADWDRAGDDVVVTDHRGRCVGVVTVTEVVRGVAEAKVEEATSMNPLTRLPGTDTVARDIERRIAAGEPFVAAWLDVDAFKLVNDTLGFAAGDELIRTFGRALTRLSRQLKRFTVGHVGGDDFLIACDVDEVASLAAELLDTTWTAENRVVSVSLATLVCTTSSVGSYRDVSKRLVPLKQRAKQTPGSSWVLGRPDTDRVEVLRGRGGREALAG